MNATDLMLGDYVQIEDEEGNLITDYICDIGYVPQWNELGVKTCKCGNEWIRESEIAPILLTKDLLDKYFTINDSYQEDFGSINRYFYKVISEHLGGTWNLVWVEGGNKNYLSIEDDPLIHMKYVHELQHVLKLCGSNKEIIL